ncbi:MAG: glucokinase [Deltaproteobacteria bacterium]|nr:glucokinase [Deltaproteobacteria bacterium]
MMRILAGDIGGTNLRLGEFTVGTEEFPVLSKLVNLPTAGIRSSEDLLELIESCAELSWPNYDFVALAVAGPIIGGKYCKLTNADCVIDLEKFPRSARVELINDFVAQAYGSVNAQETIEIQAGRAAESGTAAVIGAGTGLGKAFVISDTNGIRRAFPCEGGHVNFVSETKEEFELQEFVRQKLNAPYVVMEHLVSGSGLSLIHEFVTGKQLTPTEVALHLDGKSETFHIATKLYAVAARNFALDVLATGGLYISGGLAAKNPLLVNNPLFIETFCRSSAYHSVLAMMPVKLISHDDIGLVGAAHYARQIASR